METPFQWPDFQIWLQARFRTKDRIRIGVKPNSGTKNEKSWRIGCRHIWLWVVMGGGSDCTCSEWPELPQMCGYKVCIVWGEGIHATEYGVNDLIWKNMPKV